MFEIPVVRRHSTGADVAASKPMQSDGSNLEICLDWRCIRSTKEVYRFPKRFNTWTTVWDFKMLPDVPARSVVIRNTCILNGIVHGIDTYLNICLCNFGRKCFAFICTGYGEYAMSPLYYGEKRSPSTRQYKVTEFICTIWMKCKSVNMFNNIAIIYISYNVKENLLVDINYGSNSFPSRRFEARWQCSIYYNILYF